MAELKTKIKFNIELSLWSAIKLRIAGIKVLLDSDNNVDNVDNVDNIIIKKNPKTGNYTVIDTRTGRIINHINKEFIE